LRSRNVSTCAVDIRNTGAEPFHHKHHAMIERISKTIFLLFLIPSVLSAQNGGGDAPYFYFPRAYRVWEYNTAVGVNVTKIPMEIAEEEINISPMAKAEFRIGLPEPFGMTLGIKGNYISNMGTLGVYWNAPVEGVALSAGVKTGMWFGHLESHYFDLKTFGINLHPGVSAGVAFDDVCVSVTADVQYGYLSTSSNDYLLIEEYYPHSAYSMGVVIEQPLWNDQWVALGAKLTYARTYHQSWLSYSTIRQYLLYPELSFGFIL